MEQTFSHATIKYVGTGFKKAMYPKREVMVFEESCKTEPSFPGHQTQTL